MDQKLAATTAIVMLVATIGAYSSNSTPDKSTPNNSTLGNSTTSTIPVAVTAPPHPLQAHRTVCVGDSVTAGFADPDNWPYHLKTRLGGDWEIINQGVGGATTADMLARIDPVLELNPHFVIIMGGINDLAKGESLETIKANIGAMCTRVESYGAVPVLCTVTPTGDYLTQKDDLNTWITEYARMKGYDLIDFYAVLDYKSNPGYPDPALVYDGTHPNKEGHIAMASAIDLAIFTGNANNSTPQSTADVQ